MLQKIDWMQKWSVYALNQVKIILFILYVNYIKIILFLHYDSIYNFTSLKSSMIQLQN